jgi:hypothetical protein
MKITVNQLRKIIKEEVENVTQAGRATAKKPAAKKAPVKKAPTLAKVNKEYDKMVEEYGFASIDELADALGVKDLNDIPGFYEEFETYSDDSVRRVGEEAPAEEEEVPKSDLRKKYNFALWQLDHFSNRGVSEKEWDVFEGPKPDGKFTLVAKAKKPGTHKKPDTMYWDPKKIMWMNSRNKSVDPEYYADGTAPGHPHHW